jgi:hypothetical protein
MTLMRRSASFFRSARTPASSADVTSLCARQGPLRHPEPLPLHQKHRVAPSAEPHRKRAGPPRVGKSWFSAFSRPVDDGIISGSAGYACAMFGRSGRGDYESRALQRLLAPRASGGVSRDPGRCRLRPALRLPPRAAPSARPDAGRSRRHRIHGVRLTPIEDQGNNAIEGQPSHRQGVLSARGRWPGGEATFSVLTPTCRPTGRILV